MIVVERGNGRTPVQGVPQLPMPAQPSRRYVQRKSDKPLYRFIRTAPAVMGIIATVASWVWAGVQRQLVTRDEWHAATVKEAQFQASATQVQTAILEELRKINSRLDARPEPAPTKERRGR